jgi:CRP-like cAMP-binding protein
MAKTRPASPQSANRLLALLPPAEYDRLRPNLRPVPLPFKQVLMRARRPIDYAYFPTSGLVSALTVMGNGAAIEVGNIGNEGVAGVSAALGVLTSPHRLIVQVAGEALRVEASVLAEKCERGSTLWRLLVQYHTSFLFQVSQSVACNGLHAVQQRCCRWLLMTHDRIDGDELPLTHEFLAIMLGVRRVSVTLVLHPLQDQGLVKCGRGRITILDRKGLEVVACECYQLVTDEYNQMVG